MHNLMSTLKSILDIPLVVTAVHQEARSDLG